MKFAHTCLESLAVALPGDRGVHAVIAAFLYGLGRDVGALSGPNGLRLSDALVSLIISAFNDTTPERAETCDLADRILAYAAANLSDPGLSADTVARRPLAVQECVELVRIQQTVGEEEAVQQEAADHLLVFAVHRGVVVHEGALAAPVQHVLGKLPGECGASDGAVFPIGYPYPTGHAEAGLHDYLKNFNHEIYYAEDKNVIRGILDFQRINKMQLMIALPGSYSFLYSLTHKSISEALCKNTVLPVMILK